MILLLACAPPPPRLPVFGDPRLSEEWLGTGETTGVKLEIRVSTRVPDAGARRVVRALGDEARRLDLALTVANTDTLESGDPLASTDLAPLSALVDTLATPANDGVLLVLLPAVAGRSTAAARTLGQLAGLALSPEALRIDAEAAALDLSLPRDFTAIVLLSWEELSAMPPNTAACVALHEIGHARGLPHVSAPTNLMAPDRVDLVTLTPEQRETFR